MPNWMLSLLSRDASGLLIAALVAALGPALRAFGAPLALAALPVLAGAVLAVMSVRHLLTLARTRREHPPPGKLIDLGGYRVHVLAEGAVRDGRPPVVWFAGGHAGGLMIDHLHRALRDDTRSILIDRPGTGWSDAGPFPRTTAREADEMILALERAGEKGPFVFAGHSFGGLLCANIARRRPDLVHTLVLMDPTPLETIVFGPRLSALKDMRVSSLRGAFAQLFGINLMARHEAKMNREPVYARVTEAVAKVLGPAQTTARAIEARAAPGFAAASIYNELRPEGAAAVAWDTAVYDRDLGAMRVWLVAPKSDDDGDIAILPESKSGSAANAKRMANFYAASRERYLATSTNSRRVVAPAGSGHNFVYEHAEWTIGVMREAICGKS